MCSKSNYQRWAMNFILCRNKKIVSEIQSVTKLFIHMWKEHSHEGCFDLFPIDEFKKFLRKLYGKKNTMIQITNLLPLLNYNLFYILQ
jgi:hypothetical protein